MELVIEEIYLEESSTVVYSNIHIDNDGKCFPDENWDDFTSVLLDEWRRNLIALRSNEKVKCFFHDGPFYMDIESDKHMNLIISCVNGQGRTDCTEMVIKCSYRDMMESLYNATKVFVKIMYNNGLNTGKYAAGFRYYEQVIKEYKQYFTEMDFKN